MSAHQVAARILRLHGLPPLTGVVTDMDVWPALANATQSVVLVLSSPGHGHLHEPSPLSLPGQ